MGVWWAEARRLPVSPVPAIRQRTRLCAIRGSLEPSIEGPIGAFIITLGTISRSHGLKRSFPFWGQFCWCPPILEGGRW